MVSLTFANPCSFAIYIFLAIFFVYIFKCILNLFIYCISFDNPPFLLAFQIDVNIPQKISAALLANSPVNNTNRKQLSERSK